MLQQQAFLKLHAFGLDGDIMNNVIDADIMNSVIYTQGRLTLLHLLGQYIKTRLVVWKPPPPPMRIQLDDFLKNEAI